LEIVPIDAVSLLEPFISAQNELKEDFKNFKPTNWTEVPLCNNQPFISASSESCSSGSNRTVTEYVYSMMPFISAQLVGSKRTQICNTRSFISVPVRGTLPNLSHISFAFLSWTYPRQKTERIPLNMDSKRANNCEVSSLSLYIHARKP